MPDTKKPIMAESPTSGATDTSTGISKTIPEVSESLSSSASNSSGGVFFYDAECDFCADSARWLKRHVHESIDLEPLTPEQLKESDAARFVHDKNGKEGKTTYLGHTAIAEALRSSPQWYCRWLSAGIRFKPLRPLAKAIYGKVAKNRQSL